MFPERTGAPPRKIEAAARQCEGSDMREYSDEELKLLTDILPNVAQELRGAMANAYIAANRLAPTEARERDPKVDQNAAIFLQSYYRMYRTVGNLSAAKMLADKGRFFSLVNDDIVGAAKKVCEKAESLFRQEGVTLTFESDASGLIISMDADLIERLLLNLLSNALKFTPRGGRVDVRIKSSRSWVRLSVSDTGGGIASDKLESIFDRFLDVNAADPRPHGMGLGLALCRRIAEGHGGSIVAESAPGKGATFTVSLPNEHSMNMVLREPRFDYAGGFNRTLVELSDALDLRAFNYRFSD